MSHLFTADNRPGFQWNVNTYGGISHLYLLQFCICLIYCLIDIHDGRSQSQVSSNGQVLFIHYVQINMSQICIFWTWVMFYPCLIIITLLVSFVVHFFRLLCAFLGGTLFPAYLLSLFCFGGFVLFYFWLPRLLVFPFCFTLFYKTLPIKYWYSSYFIAMWIAPQSVALHVT